MHKLLCFLAVGVLAAASAPPSLHAKDEPIVRTQDGYTLTFDNDGPPIDTPVREGIIKAFFTVYPRMVADYNPASTHTVKISVESAYHGAAATAGGVVHWSADYLHQHPKDIDVITHEVMHIVQGYTHPSPGWLTEGIADYVRYKYGVANAEGGWSLPNYDPKQNYTDAYRVTARFLVWIENHGHVKFVKTVDAALRAGTYTPDLWKQLTGKTVDELWHDYTQAPAL